MKWVTKSAATSDLQIMEDRRAIGNNSLLIFSSGLMLIIKLQMLSSTKYFQ